MRECSTVEYYDWGVAEEIEKCHNEAKWQGENSDGVQAVVCNKHKDWVKDPQPLP